MHEGGQEKDVSFRKGSQSLVSKSDVLGMGANSPVLLNEWQLAHIKGWRDRIAGISCLALREGAAPSLTASAVTAAKVWHLFLAAAFTHQAASMRVIYYCVLFIYSVLWICRKQQLKKWEDKAGFQIALVWHLSKQENCFAINCLWGSGCDWL